MAAAVSVPIREIRRGVASFEAPAMRRQQASSLKLLTHEERSELLLEWGGYESARPARSAFGAVLDAALRAPPRNVWRLVAQELERRGGRSPLESVVLVIAAEGMATKHEVRLAVRAMCGNGQITKYVQPMPKKTERGEQVLMPTEMLKLERVDHAPVAKPVTPEERWARADEELERFSRGDIPCHETRGAFASREPDSVSSSSVQPTPRAGKISGLDRAIIERVYGSSFHPPYVPEFGRELAAVLEYTEVVVTRQNGMSTPHRRATVGEVLRSALDELPEDEHAQPAWRQHREIFVAQARCQARKILEGAVSSLRKSRGW
jgi:hypothetical protein